MNREQIVVVLVGTTQDENIGAVARAMNNMGVSSLRLVSPAADYTSHAARRMASHSEPILDQAVVYEELQEAIADCSWVVGSSARRRERLNTSFFLEDLSDNIPQQVEKIAFVFGRESSGLSNKELSLCNHLLHIQTYGEHSSLNLAQAVITTLYECSKQFTSAPTLHEKESYKVDPLASSADVARLKTHWLEVLKEVRFLKDGQAESLELSFSNLLGRAHLSEREVRMLRGFLHQTQLSLNPTK